MTMSNLVSVSVETETYFTIDHLTTFTANALRGPVLAEPPLSAMSLSLLAELSVRELGRFGQGEPSNDRYSLEIFRRAMVLKDQQAWEWLHQIFSGFVFNWLRQHPWRTKACQLDSEENYVSRTFERLWQATTRNRELTFNTLSSALLYLKASLNGTVLDTIRAYSRPKETSLPEPGCPGEPVVEDEEDTTELWEIIRDLLPNERERQLAYLLLHCGLKPREVVLRCPRLFKSVQEVYRLRRNINERLLRSADQIRWKLRVE